jgi:hypothetical protein
VAVVSVVAAITSAWMAFSMSSISPPSVAYPSCTIRVPAAIQPRRFAHFLTIRA